MPNILAKIAPNAGQGTDGRGTNGDPTDEDHAVSRANGQARINAPIVPAGRIVARPAAVTGPHGQLGRICDAENMDKIGNIRPGQWSDRCRRLP